LCIIWTGAGLLEEGWVYVQANIRGGGEFGSKWHQAALKEKRHKAYEDFAAVAEDLVKRGYTTSTKLAIQGGSNGGTLLYTAHTVDCTAVTLLLHCSHAALYPSLHYCS
jgi:prolyl oligopeptidase